ncbi:prepilin-type N-terminal cleavage/methylation domain-containing protein [Candidatus Falkowbacteria bacterium]|jgi:prepilin-type N-terminal cleavage/methylation domain-containing protein|nr:prepilin-type N-terminal cleavage/methylation domain-containing protein [Candidatus Falkowbacteria bacterium]MBT5503195.1 prepilin-type N-terminal cleavage/methylation domain-containing protein [Candidatus Falkowbacteria bacterium]MBT6573898.1 prepilin-type N-terminal cleavage/methylation domain-containing protein [Candidatus Falkowbacteria bacterium]MBT7348495.1 prepilin-type N-terminal cleavage/methylation domain-containing protein [Candidatus Falkowbacteria bacterium]MBT7500840.1 prepilin
MKKGFSLIEMLVVMAVFMTMMLVVSDIFLSVTISQRKSMVMQKSMVDLQYNMEQIAQQIRLSQIDYSAYHLPINELQDELHLINSQNQKVAFGTETVGCALGIETCLIQSIDDQRSIISADNFDIQSLSFRIAPNEDPLEFDNITKQYKSDKQPQITIYLKALPVAVHEEDQKPLALQTTISSRYYAR